MTPIPVWKIATRNDDNMTVGEYKYTDGKSITFNKEKYMKATTFCYFLYRVFYMLLLLGLHVILCSWSCSLFT